MIVILNNRVDIMQALPSKLSGSEWINILSAIPVITPVVFTNKLRALAVMSELLLFFC